MPDHAGDDRNNPPRLSCFDQLSPRLPCRRRRRGWSEASHGDTTAPAPPLSAFPSGRVLAMEIIVAPDDWAAMRADLDEIYAALRPIRDGVLAAGAGLGAEARAALARQLMAEASAAAKAAGQTISWQRLDRNPIWAPVTLRLDGREWRHVGLRFKGNHSLSEAYKTGDTRLPMKLDFDEFEDDVPDIRNQRFFGYKQLSLSNNMHDPSGLRSILVRDLLRAANLPSLRSVPCEITLDHGHGPVRPGLYTLIGSADDTGVRAFFGTDDGNIYEGIGPGASFALSTLDRFEEGLEKKNHEKAADWSDVRALHAALHDPRRLDDPAAWRALMESRFAVDGYRETLGIATFVGHFDTYGTAEATNFYLYAEAGTGRVHYISRDHNDTFNETLRGFLSFDRARATADFPLIRHLLDDPVFRARYVTLLRENAATILNPGWISSRIADRAAVIRPAATKDMTDADYDAALDAVRACVERSGTELAAFLTANP